VQPLVPELEALHTIAHELEATCSGYEMACKSEPLYQLVPTRAPQRAAFAVGLRDVARQLLVDAGYQLVSYLEAGPRMLPPVDPSLIPNSTDHELQLLDRLTRLSRAMLIVDQTRFELSTLITGLATACPTARIAVVDDHLDHNTNLYRQLDSISPTWAVPPAVAAPTSLTIGSSCPRTTASPNGAPQVHVQIHLTV
jgi:hypothetical protein